MRRMAAIGERPAQSATAEHLNAPELHRPLKTGWPPPQLMQDDDRKLFGWFASRPDARRLVRLNLGGELMTYKLPEPAWWTGSGDFTDDPHVADGWQLELDAGARSSLDALFTADQVLQAFRDGRLEGLEEAATVNDDVANRLRGIAGGRRSSAQSHGARWVTTCSTAIRALKERNNG